MLDGTAIRYSTNLAVIKGYDQDGGVARCTPSAVACLEGLVSTPEICFADESDRVKGERNKNHGINGM